MVDPTEPAIVWGYFVHEGDDVLHAALMKRRFHKEGLAGMLFAKLLGERLEREQSYTMQLGDMAKAMALPAKWRHDETWFARRLAA